MPYTALKRCFQKTAVRDEFRVEKVYAQNELDAALDRYKEICNACIELREMVGRGESVPSEKMSSLLGEMKPSRPKKLFWKEQKEMEALESEIAALNEEKASLETLLSGSSSDVRKIQDELHFFKRTHRIE